MKIKSSSRPWFVGALLFALLALAAVLLPGRSALLLFPNGQADAAVSAFFEALETGDYAAAAALCSPALPAEDPPAEEDAALVYEALCESRHWLGCESTERSGNRAVVTGQLRSLDLAALSEGLNEDVNAALAQRVSSARLGSEIYNDDGSYRDEVVSSVWTEVLSARLAHADDYCAVSSLRIDLVYRDGRWLVQADEALMRALAGGAA